MLHWRYGVIAVPHQVSRSMLNLLDDLLSVAICILQNQLDLLVVFDVFPDVTEVDQLSLTIDVGFLVFELKDLDT